MPVSRSVQFPQGYGAVRTRPGARGPVSPQSANGGSLITGLHRGRASAHIRAPVSGLKCGMTITQSLSTKITLPCASYGDAAPLSHYDQLAVSNNPIHYIPLPPQHQRRHVTKMHEEPIPDESTEIVVFGNVEVQLAPELIVGMACFGRTTHCCMMTIKWLRLSGEECSFGDWKTERATTTTSDTCNVSASNLKKQPPVPDTGESCDPNRVHITTENGVRLTAYVSGKRKGVSVYQRHPSCVGAVTGFAKELL